LQIIGRPPRGDKSDSPPLPPPSPPAAIDNFTSHLLGIVTGEQKNLPPPAMPSAFLQSSHF